MTSLIVPPAEDETAYAQIEAAVMETARGRWFLAEFARRNRHADTRTLLDAIERLQETVSTRAVAAAPAVVVTAAPAPGNERLRNDILDMARAISAMQREIHAIGANGATTTAHISASDDLDLVVNTTEQATTSILAAAEKVQEFAWTLRENAGNADDCDLLDRCATEIYTACGFQDLTAQRISKVVEVLRFIDKRIKMLLVAHDLAEDFNADEQMIAACAEPAAAQTDDIWMSEAHQAEIDDTFAFFEPAAIVAEPTMVDADLLEIEPPAPRAPVASTPEEDEDDGALDTRLDALLDELTGMVPAAPAHEDADIVEAAPAAEDPYAGLSTPEKLRAFR